MSDLLTDALPTVWHGRRIDPDFRHMVRLSAAYSHGEVEADPVGFARQLCEQFYTERFSPSDLQEKYTHKRDLFLKGLDDLKIPHTVPQGAYYILLDISEFRFDSDLAFCEVLARDVGVGAVPGSSFFKEPVNHLVRLHFAKKDGTLNEALNRLADLRKKILPR